MAYQLPYQPKKSAHRNFLETEVRTMSVTVTQLIETSLQKLLHLILKFSLICAQNVCVCTFINTNTTSVMARIHICKAILCAKNLIYTISINVRNPGSSVNNIFYIRQWKLKEDESVHMTRKIIPWASIIQEELSIRIRVTYS